MPEARIALTVTIGGVQVSKNWTREGEHPNPYEVSLPVAQAGELTTRTGDTEGIVTATLEAHGIEDDDLVDLYWDGGMRYGMTAAVTDQAVTLTGGAGDVLPAAETDVVMCVQVVIPTQIDGDIAEVLVISLEYADSTSTKLGHVNMTDAGDATITEKDLAANEPIFLDLGSDIANPITGNPITETVASHNDTVNTATLKIATLENIYYA